VPWLLDRSRRLPRVASPDPKQLQKLIADLDADDFSTREQAAEELANLGELAEPALRKALNGKPSIEVRRRVKALLDKLERLKESGASPAAQPLRGLRAIELLERLGTPEAQVVLTTLAGGAADSSLTQEAKAALARLKRWKR
jgi:hypothetical protein